MTLIGLEWFFSINFVDCNPVPGWSIEYFENDARECQIKNKEEDTLKAIEPAVFCDGCVECRCCTTVTPNMPILALSVFRFSVFGGWGDGIASLWSAWLAKGVVSSFHVVLRLKNKPGTPFGGNQKFWIDEELFWLENNQKQYDYKEYCSQIK